MAHVQPNMHCPVQFLSLSEACVMCALSVNKSYVCRLKWFSIKAVHTHTHTQLPSAYPICVLNVNVITDPTSFLFIQRQRWQQASFKKFKLSKFEDEEM